MPSAHRAAAVQHESQGGNGEIGELNLAIPQRVKCRWQVLNKKLFGYVETSQNDFRFKGNFEDEAVYFTANAVDGQNTTPVARPRQFVLNEPFFWGAFFKDASQGEKLAPSTVPKNEQSF